MKTLSLCAAFSVLSIVAAYPAVIGDIEEALKKAEAAVREDKYDEALEALADADRSATAAKDLGMIASVRDEKKRVSFLKQEFSKAQKKGKEDDPVATLAMGKFYCFIKGDWAKGLPFLAKASDEKLKAVVEADLKMPEEAGKRIAVAEAWADLMRSQKEASAKSAMADRAIQWYRAAWPSLSKDERDAVRVKSRTLQARVMQAAPKAPPVSEWYGFLNPARSIVVDSFAHYGSAAAKLSKDCPSASSGKRIAANPGKSYEISAWVLSDGTDNAQDYVLVRWFDSGGNYVGQEGPAAPIDMPFWTRISQSVKCPDNAVSMDVSAQIRSQKGFIMLDDVSLKLGSRELLSDGSFESK